MGRFSPSANLGSPTNMFNQKGQIHIIFLVLFVVGAILYLNFSDNSLTKFILPSSSTSPTKTVPSSGPLTPIIQPEVVPTPVSQPTPAPVPTPTPTPTPIVQPPIDVTPPVISNPSHRGDILPPDTKMVVITVSTDEPASCEYSANPETGRYNSMSWYDETKRFHVKTIAGLANGNSYDFFVRCQDFNGNANTGNVLISFRVLP